MSANDASDAESNETNDLGMRDTAQPEEPHESEPAPDEPLSNRKPGDQVAGRYKLEKCLGRGAFGEVWSAHDEKAFGRLVAIKFLHEEHVQNADIVARFYREGQATAALAHPNVVTLVEFGNEGGVPYLVSEFVKGRSLRSLLEELQEQNRQFPTEVALSIFRQICRGVGAAHAMDIVHRDLKPENVMVQGEGVDVMVKVLDFGVARIINRTGVSTGNTVGRTQQGQVIGSLQYMSPEQITGDTRSLDHRADVFALGAILFELLTTQQCFTGETFQTVIGAILTGKRAPVSQMRPELPAGIDAVLNRAFAIYPRDRYSSVNELLADAEKALTTAGAKTTTNRPPPMMDSSVPTLWKPTGTEATAFAPNPASIPAPPMTGAGAVSQPALAPVETPAPQQNVFRPQDPPRNIFRPPQPAGSVAAVGATMVADAGLSELAAKSAPGAATAAMPAIATPAPVPTSSGSNTAVIAAAVIVLLAGGGAAAFLLTPARVTPATPSAAPSAATAHTAAPSANSSATATPSSLASASAAPSASAGPLYTDADWVRVEAPSAPVTLGRGATGRVGFERGANVTFAGPAFRILRTEVTWGVYERWVQGDAARAVSTPSWVPQQPGARATLPVVSIPWEKARAFCQAQGGDLPTEEQWEFAARGASLRTEPWVGRTGDVAALNAFQGLDAQLRPAGSEALDATPEGLRDMAANAQEWTRSPYRQDDGTSPAWAANLRAIRGLPLREPPPSGNVAPAPLLYRNSACTGAQCTPGDLEATESVGFRCVSAAP